MENKQPVEQTLARLARRAAGPLILLAVVCCLLWKLTFDGGQYTWMASEDLSSQVLPWLNLQARAWHEGRFPLWDPYNWGGQSLVGRTEPGVMNPLNWLLFLVPLDNGCIPMVALNWYFVLSRYLGALFCYLLCRDLKRSVAASVLAGAAFGVGGYLGSAGWPQAFWGAVWTPLVLLFFLRAMRGERALRNAGLAGAFFGLSLLSGHHQIPTLTLLVVGGLWIWHLASSRWPWRRFAAIAGVFAALAFAVGAAQVLPSLEYGRLAVRWVGLPDRPLGLDERVPYLVHANWSLSPASILGLVVPGLYYPTDPYVGFVVVSLALVAVLALWARRDVRLFGGVALGGLLFSLGWATVAHGVIYALVPMMDKARSPAVAVSVLSLGLAVLAAFGLDALAEERERAAGVARRLALGCWAVAGLILGLMLVLFAAKGQAVFEQARTANAAVCALLAGGALLYRGRAARVLLVLVAVHELGNIAGHEFRERAAGWGLLDALDRHADIAAYLKRQPEPFRVEVSREDIPYNFGEWHGIEETAGNSGITRNVWRLSGLPNVHAMLGERYRIGRQPARADQVEVFAGSSGVRVFSNPAAFPRVWTVHETTGVTTEEDLRRELARPSDELRRRAALLGEAPRLDGSCAGAGDQARLVERGEARTVVQARMGCRGMLIVADTWFPGWQAAVDGRPARVWEVYGFLRGVVLEAGEHRLTLSYRPASVLWGGALSVAGLVAAGMLLAWRAKRKGRPAFGRG